MFLELDRKKAIRLALSFAKKEDIVLIAGKGHERRQQFSKMSIPFNDKDFVNELYKERLGQLKKP